MARTSGTTTSHQKAERDDEHWCFVSAWEAGKNEGEFIRHAEPLTFEAIPLMTRNYK